MLVSIPSLIFGIVRVWRNFEVIGKVTHLTEDNNNPLPYIQV